MVRIWCVWTRQIMLCMNLLKPVPENVIFHKAFRHRGTPDQRLHTGGVKGSIPVAPTMNIM